MSQDEIVKWNRLSNSTGVTQANHVLQGIDYCYSFEATTDREMIETMEHLIADLVEFAEVRNWMPHYTPRTLVLALLGEVSELGDVVKWKKDDGCDFLEKEEISQIAMELADVTIFVLRLVHTCDILGEVQKLVYNKSVTKCYGSTD